MHGTSHRGATPPPAVTTATAPPVPALQQAGPTRFSSGGATASSDPIASNAPSSAPSTREPIYKSDRERTTPPSAPDSARLPPLPQSRLDDRRYIEPSSPNSAHLPAISHARAGPSPMSSHNAGNPAHHSGGHQHPHPGPPVRQLSNPGYGAPPQGHYSSSNGAVMHSQLGYPPQNPAYGHVQGQQTYGPSTGSPSMASSGQQFAYAPMHSPVSYAPAPQRVPSQTSAYNYGPSYASPYGAQVARATQSPTELQSPMGAGGRYPMHPSPAEIPQSHTPNLGPPQKRKRKSIGDKGGESPEDEGSPGDMTPGGSAADRASKRTKTQRACDPCRRKKIRCDILADSEPPHCQHCKQYGFDCTFFLPITETRFKKKKEMEDAAKAKEKSESVREDDPSRSPVTKESQIRGDVKIYGPTSLHYLVHATNNVPRQAFDRYDTRWNVSLKIGPKGDGFIHVNEPEPNPTDEEGVKRESEAIRELDRTTMEELINKYFTEVYPYFPVLTKEEFIDQVETFPDERFLLYAVALASASRRGVSQEQFDSLRSTLNHIMRGQDTLSVSNVPNVQGLLIMQLCFDTHATYMTQPSTANYLRTGSAIRMAQDMGMHRAESGAIKHYLNRRRRVWACALIVDRWMAAAMGHPYMIDRLDCDVRLPTEEPIEEGKERPLAYLGQMVQLSLILGDVLKTIYGPTGIDKANDEELESIVKRLDDWKQNCPEDMQFSVDTTSIHAGILHMMHTCISIIFWRVFMRITYRCPVHIKFSLTVERWTSLVRASKDAVAWFCENTGTYDLWWVVSYNLISISLCLFQTWTRRKDAEAAETLKRLRDATQECENSMGTEQQRSRRKTSELISLLYEATQNTGSEKGEKAILNPTAGVALRDQATPMVFKRDGSRPGGGVYVLDKAADLQKHKDLPPGTFLVEERASARRADENTSNTSPSSQGTGGHAGPSITMNPVNYAGDSSAQLDFIGSYMNPMPSMNMVGQGNPADMTTGMENLNPILAMSDENAQQVTLINTLGQDLSEFGNIAMSDASLFTEGLPENMAHWATDWGVYFSGGNRQLQQGYQYAPEVSGPGSAGQNPMNMQPPTQ
ncbi:hypothetical protein CALVIDRAFT_537784 [Calocera viscosa TUFC12733]|uniref:Zn(2)-C6 fungal-type domain-containing protein n=1 Tax=Calocera viscosa (strain TUFC12733) TaxID=1330018 RepID=A0A167LL41_CALVF|nr:hypothetical protein CALVIDRAFT_537784 [Calocera viscosa TUFC12733]